MMGFEKKMEEMEVTQQEWEQRKNFVGFTDDDVQFLRELHPFMEDWSDEVIEDLYRHFLSFEETKSFFPNEETLNRVKTLQKEYFLGLTKGDYGEEYLWNRLEIGRIHLRIGLSPRWYMGSYSFYVQSVFPKVIEAFKSDYQRAQNTMLALLKLITLDQELAMTTYITASEKIIEHQSREILEMSTPVMRVWEGVVVAPVIGSLDTYRTQQLMEQLLEKIVETNSSIALLDITGVPSVDTKIAQHLIETITAARLLGAKVVLTGVRPALAQTIVHLGIDLKNVDTVPSLVAGMRYAFQELNLTVTGKNGNQ